MKDNHTLLAFMATLVAIVVLFIVSSVLAYNGKSVEAIGIGGVMTGLIGVLGTFKPRTSTPDEAQAVTVTNTSDEPVPTTNEEPKP